MLLPLENSILSQIRLLQSAISSNYLATSQRGIRASVSAVCSRKGEFRSKVDTTVTHGRYRNEKSRLLKEARLPSPPVGRRSRFRLSSVNSEYEPHTSVVLPLVEAERIEGFFASATDRFLKQGNSIELSQRSVSFSSTPSNNEVIPLRRRTENIENAITEKSFSPNASVKKTTPTESESFNLEAMKILRELNSLTTSERCSLWNQIHSPQTPIRYDSEERQIRQSMIAFSKLFYARGILLYDVPPQVFFDRVKYTLEAKQPSEFFQPAFIKALKTRLYGTNSLPLKVDPTLSSNERIRDPLHIKVLRQRLIEESTRYDK